VDNTRDEIDPCVIRAAGGVVWWNSPRGREIAVIRRTRHGEEWTLPKGKLQSGESWLQAALREVTEETGCEVSLGQFAGSHAYIAKGHPKLVLFWNMELVRAGQPRDSGEVKELRWMTVPDAIQQLKHPGEKRLLKEARADVVTLSGRLKSWRKRFWLSASAQRLGESLPCYSIELQALIQEAEDKNLGEKSWGTLARALLANAEEALKDGDEDRGWHCFLAAQRMELRILHAVNPAALQLRGQTLCAEAEDKLKSWRKERVHQVLRNAQASQPSVPAPPTPLTGGPPPPDSPSVDRRTMSVDEISEIAEILHRHFENSAVKRRAQAKHLLRLISVGLGLAVLWLVLLSLSPGLRAQMGEDAESRLPRLTLAVMLFGVLGASLSGLLSTFTDPGKVKIPELLFSFRVTLARLVVGLLSAVAANVMLTSRFLRIGDLEPSTLVILLAALVAGFSERLVTGALKKASGD
jgi:8-oxo-dGTP diphosphatase